MGIELQENSFVDEERVRAEEMAIVSNMGKTAVELLAKAPDDSLRNGEDAYGQPTRVPTNIPGGQTVPDSD